MTNMNLSRFVFTIVGCHQCSDLVSAFVPSRLLHSRSSPWDLYATLESVIEEEQEDKPSPEELIDEAVLLYSIVSQRTKFDDNTEADNDILKMRGGELTMLIEDAVFDARGIVRGGAAMEDDEPTKKPETLSEISQALDNQILLGYEATFTEEELEKWIDGIDALQQKLQSMLAALPPGSDITTEPTAPQAPTPLDQLYDRLGTMRTLIDPVADHRLRLPLAQPAVVENKKPEINGAKSEVNTPSKLDVENAFFESMNTAAASRNGNAAPTPKTTTEKASVETKIPAVEKKATKSVPSEVELENALIESMNKAAENDGPNELELENALIESMNKAAQDNPPNELEMENAMIEAMNKAAKDDTPSETTTELELENSLIESMNKASAQKDAPTKAINELELENALIEAMNKAAENEVPTEAPTELEIENAVIESMNKAAEDDEQNTNNSTVGNGLEEHSETTVASYEGTDVISTVAMAAAVGATAVTKLPLVLAGVALGPVIRDSVAYAKSRTKKFKEDKAKAELEAKEKKKDAPPPKPKAWSAFDPKPNKKVTPKDNSNSDSGKES